MTLPLAPEAAPPPIGRALALLALALALAVVAAVCIRRLRPGR